MIAVSASRASVRRAQRAVRSAERAALTAERRTLLRGAGNVRRMEIAMLKGRATKAGPKVAPLDKTWRAMMHPGEKMGGALAQKHLWHIGALSRSAREVDIAAGLQPYLERWERGGDARAAVLRRFVTTLQATPQGRHLYHRAYARRPGWPADPLALPPVGAMPERDIRSTVSRYADRHLPEWYREIYRKLVSRRA